MKTTSLKLIQVIRQVNYAPARAILPKQDALYLMNFRASLTIADLPLPRYLIPVRFKSDGQIHAQPVKITHG